MKKITKLLTLLVAALFSATTMAQVPEGYNEVSDFTYGFESLSSSNFNANSAPMGWGYIGTSTSRYSRTGTKHAGSYAVYVYSDYSTTSVDALDYIVTPQVKGEIKFWARGYNSSSSYEGTQLVKVYKVTKGEDGKFIRPTEDDLINVIDLGLSTTYEEVTIGTLDEYSYVAIALSRAYIDDFSATSALMPQNPGLEVTSITGVWTDNNPLYSDAEGKATYAGTFKVKNSGDVTLVAGRDNYSVTLTSQSNYITIPETIIPITVDLAPGVESEEIPFEVVCTMVNPAADQRSALRVTSNLPAHGTTATTSANYKQTSWFTMKTYAPVLEVRNYQSYKMASELTTLGNVLLADAKTKLTLRSLGGTPVVLKEIKSNNANVAFFDGEEPLVLPLSVDPTVEKDITMAFTATGGQSAEFTFVYGTTYNDAEYTYSTKAVSAVVLDPTLYYEDFDPYLTVPTGWSQPGWVNERPEKWEFKSSSSNTYAAYSTQNSEGDLLMTPKLTFTEGQTLTVAAQPRTGTSSTSNSVYVKVYYSADRVNWNVAGIIINPNHALAKEVDESLVLPWQTTSGAGTLNSSYCKPYVISGIPAGDWYIGFESGYSIIDFIFGGKLTELDNDIYVSNMKVDAGKAMVNYPVTATIKYTNMLNNTAPARAITLYNGDEVVEEIKGAELEAYAQVCDTIVFTPHAAGEMNLRFVIANEDGDYTVESAATTVNIKEEVMVAELNVGESTGKNSTPIGSNYNKYRGEWIWTADKVGAEAGTVITGITLRYDNTSKDMVKKVKVYLMSTDDEKVSGTKFYPVDELTPNYSNDEFAMPMNTENLVFPLDVPYTYDGKNIRVVFQFDGTNFATTSFYTMPGSSIYYRNDSNVPTDDKSVSTSSYIPVATLSIAVSAPVISGTVSDIANPVAVEGAKIIVKSGDVYYTTMANENGKYSVEVLQPKLEYTIVASADGYKEFTVEPAVYSENTTVNIAMIPVVNTIKAGTYTITADVAVVEGLPAKVPADFQKYVGEGYNTTGVLVGDEKALVITENDENSMFNNLKIVGDAVKFSPDTIIELNGKKFTFRALANEEEVEGELSITKTSANEYTMEPVAVFYKYMGKAIKVAEVSNIIIKKETSTGINAVNVATVKAGKFLNNGKLVIIKNGAKFNVSGTQMK